MSDHTPTPWMTNRAGEMLPDDWMIVADMGKTPNGIQQISTVARALSIRQTPETTAANAAFIVKAVNNHERMLAALRAQEQAEEAHLTCSECEGEEIPELCGTCFPLYDDARQARRLILADLIAPRHT